MIEIVAPDPGKDPGYDREVGPITHPSGCSETNLCGIDTQRKERGAKEKERGRGKLCRLTCYKETLQPSSQRARSGANGTKEEGRDRLLEVLRRISGKRKTRERERSARGATIDTDLASFWRKRSD